MQQNGIEIRGRVSGPLIRRKIGHASEFPAFFPLPDSAGTGGGETAADSLDDTADTDVVVVGGGILGLASAAALARAGRSVVLVERNARIAQETSTRNSEVVHAGIYYPKGSLKARLCVAGREALYARCERQGIPHRKLGKLIVASQPDELEPLRFGHSLAEVAFDVSAFHVEAYENP